MVNACHSSALNKITFPAGILQFPFFTDDSAVSYGAAGMMISHEMTHSFDNEGRKYDANGNQNDWWTEEDSKRYEIHAKTIIDQFNKYVVNFSDSTSLNVRGELCLSENIADLGGLTVAFAALKRHMSSEDPSSLHSSSSVEYFRNINGYSSEQRFFLGYAQLWRLQSTDAVAKNRINNDTHSPAFWRVNGPLSQMSEFREAFCLPDNCIMVVPENERSTMWSR